MAVCWREITLLFFAIRDNRVADKGRVDLPWQSTNELKPGSARWLNGYLFFAPEN